MCVTGKLRIFVLKAALLKDRRMASPEGSRPSQPCGSECQRSVKEKVPPPRTPTPPHPRPGSPEVHGLLCTDTCHFSDFRHADRDLLCARHVLEAEASQMNETQGQLCGAPRAWRWAASRRSAQCSCGNRNRHRVNRKRESLIYPPASRL